jgi:hypothetical protein
MCSTKVVLERAFQDTDYHPLASHLVTELNSRSGGHEFEFPMRRELGALTKSGKTLGVRSSYSVIVSVIFDLSFFQDVIQYMQLNDPTGRWVQPGTTEFFL